VNRAKMKNQIERSAEMAFEFKQGFFSKFKDSNTFKLNLNWIQSRKKSNDLFGDFSNLKLLKIDSNIEVQTKAWKR
jgi:hypothetical protein